MTNKHKPIRPPNRAAKAKPSQFQVRNIALVNRFSKTTRDVWAHFQKIQTNHHAPERFRWDFWHIKDRYTHFRTPAELYLSGKLLSEMTADLESFGARVLGCSAISPLWLSAYTDGCEQKLHLDQPHGPWAFVLPISPRFQFENGGSTLLLKSTTLSHWSPNSFEWRSKHQPRPLEFDELVERVEPVANRLLVFDPRIPHGVECVSGSKDLLDARLVLHGWFRPPVPYTSLTQKEVKTNQAALTGLVSQLDQAIAETVESWGGPQIPQGTLSYRFSFRRDGSIRSIRPLASTLQAESEALVLSFENHLWSYFHAAFENLKPTQRVTTPKGFELTYPVTLQMES